MNLGKRHVDFSKGNGKRLPLVLVNDYAGETTAIRNEVSSLTAVPFDLLLVSRLDWENDLTPWPATHLGRGLGEMAGKADEYLSLLMEEVVPKTIKSQGLFPSSLFLAGYSLGGLFALYAGLSSNYFDGVASASGSLWYPDFSTWVKGVEIPAKLHDVYLSFGDKEPNSRNAYLQTVGTRTKEIYDLLLRFGLDVKLEVNPGNHFQDGNLRLAKGIAFLLESETKRKVAPSQ